MVQVTRVPGSIVTLEGLKLLSVIEIATLATGTHVGAGVPLGVPVIPGVPVPVAPGVPVPVPVAPGVPVSVTPAVPVPVAPGVPVPVAPGVPVSVSNTIGAAAWAAVASSSCPGCSVPV